MSTLRSRSRVYGSDISIERTILTYARQAVDRWRRTPRNRSFDEAMDLAANELWDHFPDTDRERQAFCAVAKVMLDAGAVVDSGRLIEIIHRILLDEST